MAPQGDPLETGLGNPDIPMVFDGKKNRGFPVKILQETPICDGKNHGFPVDFPVKTNPG